MTLDLRRPGVAAITGTASGLGRAFATTLASRGWTLELSDIDHEANEETRGLCLEQGASVRVEVLDTRDADATQRWVDGIVERHGKIDLMINNAGVAGVGNFGEIDLELWRWVVDINLLGPVYGCNAVVPHMRAAGSGHIINVASIAAFASAPGMGPYNATKSGVVSISETLAAELDGTDIGVTVACPSFFKTAIGDNTRGASPGQRKLMGRMVNQSKIRAEDIATEILNAAQARRAYVLPQMDARAMWRLRRAMPASFNRITSVAVRLSHKLLR